MTEEFLFKPITLDEFKKASKVIRISKLHQQGKWRKIEEFSYRANAVTITTIDQMVDHDGQWCMVASHKNKTPMKPSNVVKMINDYITSRLSFDGEVTLSMQLVPKKTPTKLKGAKTTVAYTVSDIEDAKTITLTVNLNSDANTLDKFTRMSSNSWKLTVFGTEKYIMRGITNKDVVAEMNWVQDMINKDVKAKSLKIQIQ